MSKLKFIISAELKIERVKEAGRVPLLDAFELNAYWTAIVLLKPTPFCFPRFCWLRLLQCCIWQLTIRHKNCFKSCCKSDAFVTHASHKESVVTVTHAFDKGSVVTVTHASDKGSVVTVTHASDKGSDVTVTHVSDKGSVVTVTYASDKGSVVTITYVSDRCIVYFCYSPIW